MIAHKDRPKSTTKVAMTLLPSILDMSCEQPLEDPSVNLPSINASASCCQTTPVCSDAIQNYKSHFRSVKRKVIIHKLNKYSPIILLPIPCGADKKEGWREGEGAEWVSVKGRDGERERQIEK